MRIRTAKTLAERIDLNYFKRAHGLRRWRSILSIAMPALAVLWIAGLAAAGSRRTYSAGPVSSAHAFAENRCEVCHRSAGATVGFRAHVSDTACLTCHDAPAHALNQTTPPACGSCHVEHSGRVQLAKVADRMCLDCHGDLKTAHGAASVAANVGRFPSGHPEFAVARGRAKDPGTIKFDHAVHVKAEGIRSLTGVEVLQCTDCHQVTRILAPGGGSHRMTSGPLSSASYRNNCARCHGLEFDYRIAQPAPHDKPEVVRAAVRAALQNYIAAHPGEVGKRDDPRRLPLNFPVAPQPAARNAAEWVTRRADNAEHLLWSRCDICHTRGQTGVRPGSDQGQTGVRPGSDQGQTRVRPLAIPLPSSDQGQTSVKPGSDPLAIPLPSFAASNITTRWMTRATFDHTPHLMVRCGDCHAAERSQLTSDVLMPNLATCATCHAPSRGAEARCFECHPYHDWSKAHAVAPAFTLTDFK